MSPSDRSVPQAETNFKVSVTGRLSADAVLISMSPYSRLRAVAFDFDIVRPNSRAQTILKVAPYEFDWHPNYVLKTPRPLEKGTLLRWTATFAPRANSTSDRDSVAEPPWGEESWSEIMTGFFDVAVDAPVDAASIRVLDRVTDSKAGR